ncbi:hypothetical protein L9F63_028098, partial [Diploptera punctata]
RKIITFDKGKEMLVDITGRSANEEPPRSLRLWFVLLNISDVFADAAFGELTILQVLSTSSSRAILKLISYNNTAMLTHASYTSPPTIVIPLSHFVVRFPSERVYFTNFFAGDL